MFYLWLILIIILSIIEMTTTNLVCIWFIISGLFSLLLSLVTDSLIIQLTVFVLGGTILLPFTKKISKKFFSKNEKTNFDRIIGMFGIVTDDITKTKPGEVKVDGKYWTAIANKSIKSGSSVKIVEINSTKLVVEEEEK